MRLKPWRLFVPLVLISTGILASADTMAQQANKLEPLVIQEQGSFAVGGTVATAPGTFEPRKPLEPAGQTSTAITSMRSTRSP